MEKTLELKRMPDDGVYKLDHEYFTDADGRIWQNAGRVGDRPMRLYHCEPSGEPSSPIYGDIVRVTVDGVDADFLRFNRETWEWEKRSATALDWSGCYMSRIIRGANGKLPGNHRAEVILHRGMEYIGEYSTHRPSFA